MVLNDSYLAGGKRDNLFKIFVLCFLIFGLELFLDKDFGLLLVDLICIMSPFCNR